MELIERLKWGADGLAPVMVTDSETGRPLVLCFMDRDALWLTLETGMIHTYSRSRGRVARKGERSGHSQIVKRIRINCNEDSLQFEVEQKVAACHMGYFSCYYREVDPKTGKLSIVDERIFDPDQVYG